MNKDEMIKDMQKDLVLSEQDCVWLYEKDGYRKIADDEMIIKKSEYKELKKYRTDWLNDEKMHLQAELEDTEFELGCSNRLFQKVCKEKKELEEQLKRAEQGTRNILQELKNKLSKLHSFGDEKVIIELLAEENGIELEDNNE